jgi:hypothetical protein
MTNFADKQKATKNIHVHEQTMCFETVSLFDPEADGEYGIFLDFPDGLPEGLQIEDAPGGIRVFSDNPIPDELIFTIGVEGATPEDELRIEFTDVDHQRLGYTMAAESPFEIPEQISFSNDYQNCVNHTDHGQSSPSILEWVLFADHLDKSAFTDIAITVEVTSPSGSKSSHLILLNAEGKAFLLFQIFVFGNYGLEVIGAHNVPTQEALELAGTLLFPFVVYADETNKGQCNN